MSTRGNERAGSCRVLLRLGLLLVVLGMTRSVFADGVTLFVHGWNPELAGTPAWMGSMRTAVAREFLGDEQNYAQITIEEEGGLVATCDPWDYDLATGSTGEVLIVVDWTDVADHLAGGPGSRDVAERVVECLVNGQNGRPPVAELPIHLVGHSRGGGMVCEIARLLGEQGVLVDHVTPIDPHPLTAADPQPAPPSNPILDAPAEIYENVVFADAYSQLAEYPEGEYVDGAYNRMWDHMPGGYHDNVPPAAYANHRNPLLMYQATIDPDNPVDNGEATLDATERAAWFNAVEAAGSNTGFTTARIDGAGERTSGTRPVSGGDEIRDGLHANPLLGGQGTRQDLAWGNAVWPNVALLEVLEDGTPLRGDPTAVAVGTPLVLRYVYLDFDSGCTVELYADLDRNPYNGDAIFLGARDHAAATGEVYTEHVVDWDTSDWDGAETMYVYARIHDGVRTRYYYAAAGLSFHHPGAAPGFAGTGCGVNHPPIPDAGPDQTACVGERVPLDGSASYDIDEGVPPSTMMSDPEPQYVHQRREDLQFQWAIAVLYYASGRPVLAVPEGADVHASMQGFNEEQASFIPDVPGTYQFDLFVTDDFDATLSDRVVVTVLDCDEAAPAPRPSFEFERFVVHPMPFDELVRFGFVGVGEPDWMHVAVYDLSGRRLWHEEIGGAAEISWDGRTSEGEMLASGAYIYRLALKESETSYDDVGVLFINR